MQFLLKSETKIIYPKKQEIGIIPVRQKFYVATECAEAATVRYLQAFLFMTITLSALQAFGHNVLWFNTML